MSARRVCIHTDRDGHPVAVDVALPSGAPVGELLPAIVDLVNGRSIPVTSTPLWRLDRPDGAVLDESLSLIDNGVHDGELLTLSHVHAPALGVLRREPGFAVIATPLPGDELARLLPGAGCLAAVTLAAVALAWSAGSEHAVLNAIVVAVGACVAAAMTMGMTRGTTSATTSAAAFVILATATGFLAVPSAPSAPNVFLAAAAGLAASLSMVRLTGRTSPALIAAVALSTLSAVVTVVVLPTAIVGVALAGMSLGLLAVAPRIAALVARPGIDRTGHPDAARDDDFERAATAHDALTGLVIAGAAGIASGALIVAWGGAAEARGAVAFIALLAAILTLRARVYADAIRRMTLGAGAFVSVGTFLWVAVDAYPQFVCVGGALLVVTGLMACAAPRLERVPARLLDRLEYVALAVVVPVGCWAAGVYSAMGGVLS